MQKISLGWAVLCCATFGCSGQSEQREQPGTDGPSTATSADQGAPEMLQVRGRNYIRRDLLTAAEYDQIVYEGRASLPSTTPEVLAAQMRGHTIANGVSYIELEPNVELARELLANPNFKAGTQQRAPREERGVIGSDTRTHSTPNNTYPNTTIGFIETGCSGTKIGARTIYTAAHCIYETTSANAWYCQNGSTAQSCANWPRWRFGVEDGGGFTNWTANGCHWQTIPNAFVSLTDPNTGSEETWWDFARWDYAVVDLRQCVTGNTGWLGTWIPGDATLTDNTFFLRGYPGRATCPSGSVGTVGSPAPGGGVTGSDCPGTGNWPGSTWRYNSDTSKPFSGAEIWTSSDTNVNPGSQQAAGSISTTIDVTQGNSGSGLYYLFAAGDRRVVGVASSSGSAANRFNRFTSEVYNFFVANSDYPDDTL